MNTAPEVESENAPAKEAVERAGGTRPLAQQLNVSYQAVQKWMQTGVPATRVLDVERVTGVSRHVLRPDVFGEAPTDNAAADMDCSPSDLTRKLSGNPEDHRRFSVEDLERYIQVTGDTQPVYYLVEKYLAGGGSEIEALERRLAQLKANQVASAPVVLRRK